MLFLQQKKSPLFLSLALRFLAKITSSCIWVAIPVDWVILHWHACGVDGGSLSLSGCRSVFSHVIAWVDYHIFLPMVLCCMRFVSERSATKRNEIEPDLRLRHPNHFVLVGTNNRNVIITYQFLVAPAQGNQDFFWHNDCIFQESVSTFLNIRVSN